MTEDAGIDELPGAVAEYAAGVGDVIARGLIVVAVPVLLIGLLALVIVGGGVALVVLALLAPAIAAAVWLEVPSRIRGSLG